jgi:rare lipoprotein A
MLRSIFVGKSCCAFVLALGCLSASAERSSTGLASFYAAVPDPSEKLTAAHRHLPFGTMVSVTRIDTSAHVVVRINDRGPFIQGRIIDLSHAAAQQLGMIDAGVARVRIQIIPAPVRANRAMHDREAAFKCLTCQLPALLD